MGFPRSGVGSVRLPESARSHRTPKAYAAENELPLPLAFSGLRRQPRRPPAGERGAASGGDVGGGRKRGGVFRREDGAAGFLVGASVKTFFFGGPVYLEDLWA